MHSTVVFIVLKKKSCIIYITMAKGRRRSNGRYKNSRSRRARVHGGGNTRKNIRDFGKSAARSLGNLKLKGARALDRRGYDIGNLNKKLLERERESHKVGESKYREEMEGIMGASLFIFTGEEYLTRVQH